MYTFPTRRYGCIVALVADGQEWGIMKGRVKHCTKQQKLAMFIKCGFACEMERTRDTLPRWVGALDGKRGGCTILIWKENQK
jgi:hypothetical protein